MVVHAWAGPQDLLAAFAAANVYFSVGTRELARLPPADLRAIPAERLLIETDDRCPWRGVSPRAELASVRPEWCVRLFGKTSSMRTVLREFS